MRWIWEGVRNPAGPVGSTKGGGVPGERPRGLAMGEPTRLDAAKEEAAESMEEDEGGDTGEAETLPDPPNPTDGYIPGTSPVGDEAVGDGEDCKD